MQLLIIIMITLVCLAKSQSTSTTTVYNNLPRRDVNGNILHVSDGNLVYFKSHKKFFLYGTKYQPCGETPSGVGNESSCYFFCGWRNMTYAVYSSPNLSQNSWTLESDNVLPDIVNHPSVNHSTSAFFEPSVIYNEITKMYVMWFIIQNNLRPHIGVRGQGVATSKSPIGPFHYVGVPPIADQPPSADLYLWVDSDTQKAYMKHNVGPAPNGNLVSLLNDDYTSINRTSGPIENGTYYEGGGIFKRNGSWFVMFGKGCCFCPFGGSSRLYMAKDPIDGPWNFIREINSLNPFPPPNPIVALHGFYSSKHTDDAIMGQETSMNWAKNHTYDEWSMFGGHAGKVFRYSEPGLTALVSYYSDEMQDWMLTATNEGKTWAKKKKLSIAACGGICQFE